MLKINTLIACIALACILISCHKPEQNKNNIPDSQVKQDSIKSRPDPLKDTIIQKTNIPDQDSLSAIKEKKKKKKNDSLKALKESEVKIEAYYFHPTARCVTCRNIEAYSLEAIQQWEEMSNKSITWKELNIEDPVNEHYVDEYSLEFSSLIIVKYIGGKKDVWKNLEDTWKLVNDKSALIKYVIHELNRFYNDN